MSGSFIAPYWVDNDPSMGGSVSYEVHSGTNSLLNQVSNGISRIEGVEFSGTWMLVAYWLDVPLFSQPLVSGLIFRQSLVPRIMEDTYGHYSLIS